MQKQRSNVAPLRSQGAKQSSSSSSQVSNNKATRKGRKVLQNGMTVQENIVYQSLQKQCESLARKANQRRQQIISNARDLKRYNEEMFFIKAMEGTYEAQMESVKKFGRVADKAEKSLERLDMITKDVIDSSIIERIALAADAVRLVPQKCFEVLKEKGASFATEIALTLSRLAVAPTLAMVAIEIISVFSKFTNCIGDVLSFFVKHVKTLFEWGKSYLKTLKQDRKEGESAYEAQMFGEDLIGDWPKLLPYGAGLAALLGSALLGVKMTKQGEASQAFSQWAQFGANLSKMRSGVKTVFDFVAFVMEETKQFVMRRFPTLGIKSSTVAHFKARYNFDLLEYVKDVIELTDPTRKELVLADPTTRIILDELLSKTATISIDIVGGHVVPSPAVASQLRDVRMKILEFAKTFDALDSSSAGRFTPFVVCLSGQAGCGKSVACDLLAKTISDPRWCKVPMDHQNLIYARNSMDKYWSLYNGQSITILDDFGQKRGSTPSESEYAEFINLVSAVQWSVPMAAVEDKGKRFKGKLILMTTNDTYPVPSEIMCKDAVWRRRNVLVECLKKDGAPQLPNPVTDCIYNVLDPMNNEKGQNYLSVVEKQTGKSKIMVGISYQELCSFIVPKFNKYWNDFVHSEQTKTVPDIDIGLYEIQSNDIPMKQVLDDEEENFVEAEFEEFEDELNWNVPDEQIFRPRWLDFSEPQRPRLFEQYATAHGNNLPENELDYLGANVRYYDFEHEGNWYPTCCDDGAPLKNPFEDISIRYCMKMDRFLTRENKVVPIVSDTPQALLTFEEKCCIFEYYCQGKYVVPYELRGEFPDWEPWMSTPVFNFSWQFAMRVRQAWWKKLVGNDYEVQTLDWLPWVPKEDKQDSIAQMAFEDDLDIDRFTEACQEEEDEILEAIENFEDPEPDVEFENISDKQLQKQKAKILMRKRIVKALKIVGFVVVAFTTAAAAYSIKKLLKPKEKCYAPDTGLFKRFVSSFPNAMQEFATDVTVDLAQKAVVGTLQNAMFAEGAGRGSGDHRTLYPKKEIRVQRLKAEFGSSTISNWQPSMQIEGTKDKNALDFARNKLPHNLVTLKMIAPSSEGEEKLWSICGLGLRDRLLLVPYHWVAIAKKRVVPVLVSSIFGDVEEEIDFAKVKRIVYQGQAQDLAIIKLSMRHHAFKKVVENFVSEKELDRLNRTEAMMLRVGDFKGARVTMEMTGFDCVADLQTEQTYGGNGETYMLLRGFHYRCNTVKGDCGSALIAINEHIRGKIMGVHVAGQMGTCLGMSVPVTREMIEEQLSEYESQGLCERITPTCLQDLTPEQIDGIAKIRPGGNLKVVGIVEPEYGQRLPQVTDIIPSLLHGKLTPPTTEPAVLTPSDERVDPELRAKGFSPMEVGLTKFETPCHPFPPRDLDLAKQVILSEICSKAPCGMEKRLLTLDETINGVPTANFARVNMGTSPGMPYKNHRGPGEKGKYFLFKSHPLENGEVTYEIDREKVSFRGTKIGEILYQNYIENNKKIRQGIVPEWYTYSNLKQERRKKSKIFAGETRLFECSPLDQTLLYRKYFGAFITTMNQNCTSLPSSVGINPEGPDWTSLYLRLSKFGGMVLAGDYKGWDGILPGDVMEKALEVINEWYDDGEENALARRTLIETAIHTFILCRDVMILKNQGIPSGIPVTADLNGLCNWLYMLCCLFQLCRENNYPINAEDVRRMIEFAFYGDDHVVAPHPNIQHFFTFHNVKRFFEEKGITYTDAMKTGKDPNPLEPLQKVTYLKRMFVPNEDFPDKIMAPIDMGTIDEEINWIRKSADDFEATFQNVSAAKLQLVQHGRQTFERKMNQVNQVIAKERAKDLKYGQSTRWTTFSVDYDNELQNWLDQFG